MSSLRRRRQQQQLLRLPQAMPVELLDRRCGPQKTDDGGAKEDPNSEKAWRKRFKEQRDKASKGGNRARHTATRVTEGAAGVLPDPQKALTEQNTRKDVNEKMAKIAAKKQEIAQLKQGLEDMEAELRKSGGDPGWAR